MIRHSIQRLLSSVSNNTAVNSNNYTPHVFPYLLFTLFPSRNWWVTEQVSGNVFPETGEREAGYSASVLVVKRFLTGPWNFQARSPEDTLGSRCRRTGRPRSWCPWGERRGSSAKLISGRSSCRTRRIRWPGRRATATSLCPITGGSPSTECPGESPPSILIEFLNEIPRPTAEETFSHCCNHYEAVSRGSYRCMMQIALIS